jgi:Holliday junction resolvasome RuvABC endonuclease subunit
MRELTEDGAMKHRRITRNTIDWTETLLIKTTFLELIQELAKLTKDDNHVVAAVKNIFRQYNVKFTRTLTPVKLVATAKPVRARVGKRPSWA